ncbi:TraR/DksA family transcriptional regulator [Enterobacter roggenkampii]|uniref:TraR/DksA family transcriptional regulator n=1 Tax=Enterobacter roggenkampii TaxID=1812935 RepID=UPI0032AEBB70
MANCQNSNERLFGGAVVLEVADGCPDVKPLESEWKALAAGTSKGFDFNPNSVTSDADDGGGYVETIITNSDFTLSFEGEVRKKDKLDQYGVGKFIKYFADELKAKRQPGIWVRMDYGPVEFIGYMNITALSSDGGTNDIVTFSTEFKVGDASTIEVNEITAVAVTGVTVSAHRLNRNAVSAERCEECDEPIPEPRRAAVPGCQTCADCQSVIELKNKQRGV